MHKGISACRIVRIQIFKPFPELVNMHTYLHVTATLHVFFIFINYMKQLYTTKNKCMCINTSSFANQTDGRQPVHANRLELKALTCKSGWSENLLKWDKWDQVLVVSLNKLLIAANATETHLFLIMCPPVKTTSFTHCFMTDSWRVSHQKCVFCERKNSLI